MLLLPFLGLIAIGGLAALMLGSDLPLKDPPLRSYSNDANGKAEYVRDAEPYAAWFGKRAFPNLSPVDQKLVTLAWGIAEHGWQFGSPGSQTNWPGNTELEHQAGDTGKKIGADVHGSQVYDTIAHGLAANLKTVQESKFWQFASLSDPYAVMNGLGNGTWGTDAATWKGVYEGLKGFVA